MSPADRAGRGSRRAGSGRAGSGRVLGGSAGARRDAGRSSARRQPDAAQSGAAGAVVLRGRGMTVTLGGQRVLDDVSVAVTPGELVSLVGPNGAGKSTALAALAGERALDAGEVTIGGRPLSVLGPRAQARRRAVLPQSGEVAFDYLVRDVVAMGRTPWPDRAGEDEAVVDASMAATQVAYLAGRTVTTLSGGERARALLARVLAQTTGTVLLDEPTAALDVAHQEAVLALARGLADEGHGVLAVLHDLSLAAAWSDRMILMRDGRVVADGVPWDVCREDLLSEVYGWPLRVARDPGGGAPVVMPVRASTSARARAGSSAPSRPSAAGTAGSE